ncbi:hypothetical protein Microterr_09940 [Microbacterium terricola]|uniref:Uncharacterized protein n=1 Tax=Microbacterium terricola TaxID=344163 RepID=A0ABM8DXI2_9MICO|nr:hypothetical protein Microterr_09940 [Microbacterium terricola]
MSGIGPVRTHEHATRVNCRSLTVPVTACRARPSGMLEAMAGSPNGFEFTVRGEHVEIRHHGRVAATLRKSAAAKFLDDVQRDDPQHVMARVTGNYKRGNERPKTRRP